MRHRVNFDNLTPLYPKERLKLEIHWKSGEELERLVGNLLSTPPAVLDQVRQAIQLKEADAAQVKGGGGDCFVAR